jgi:hypothetical protein
VDQELSQLQGFSEIYIVRDENLDVNTQYKKTYKGPDLIQPNEQKTHTMATRSTKAPRVVIRRTKEILPNQ